VAVLCGALVGAILVHASLLAAWRLGSASILRGS
jgi:hypothetical protein